MLHDFKMPSIRFDKVLVAENSSRSLNYRQTNRATNNCIPAFQIRLRFVPLFLGCTRLARRSARALINFKILLRASKTRYTFYFQYRPKLRNGPETFWNIFALFPFWQEKHELKYNAHQWKYRVSNKFGKCNFFFSNTRFGVFDWVVF